MKTDKKILIAMVKDMTKSMTGKQSTMNWAETFSLLIPVFQETLEALREIPDTRNFLRVSSLSKKKNVCSQCLSGYY